MIKCRIKETKAQVFFALIFTLFSLGLQPLFGRKPVLNDEKAKSKLLRIIGRRVFRYAFGEAFWNPYVRPFGWVSQWTKQPSVFGFVDQIAGYLGHV